LALNTGTEDNVPAGKLKGKNIKEINFLHP
jgi:hypothetical protein